MTAQDGSLVGQTLGVYRLRSLLGVGGMAEVYLAEDPSLRRDIAVKVLPRTLASDPNYVDRFRNEAQRVASLSHPNITPVYTFGEERGLLYLVMPRLKESLRERMEQVGRIPLQEAARLTNQIAAALYIAHQHGIVHRDVKPENILLDESGKAMLTDFGIAREMSALREAGMARTLAATGLPVGTPEYMAPEQLRGAPATEQVDLYALGVVLYEMLTGHVPHDASTPYEVATAVLRDQPQPPSFYNAEITPELEGVILMAMAKDPERRYGDMKTFALALRGAMNGESRAPASGALRWTRYAPPGQVGASSALAGAALGAGALGETSKRSAITQGQPMTSAYSSYGSASQPLHRPRFARRSLALLAALSLVALIVLLIAGVTLTNAMGLFTNSVGSPSLAVHSTMTTAPTASPAPTSTPAATATATQPAATATPIVIVITATPAPPPPDQAMALSTTTVTFSGSKCNASSPLIISNPTNKTVTWKWTGVQPWLPFNFQWNLNNTGSHGNLPYDSQGLASGRSDSLQLKASCYNFQNNQTYMATMTDSLGHTYTITLKDG